MAAKKTTTRRSSSKMTPSISTGTTYEDAEVIEAPEISTAEIQQATKIKKSYVVWIIIALIVVGFLYIFRGWIVAAIVNGQPITRLQVIKELERQNGKQVLNSLITRSLILQEARKNGVTVSSTEIDTEIKKYDDNFKKQGQSLDTVLAQQGMTRQDLREQIIIQKSLDKMLGKDIKISDKEVQDYIDKNKDSLPQGQNAADLKTSVKQQLYQQKLNEKISPWIQNLQKNAKIIYFTNL